MFVRVINNIFQIKQISYLLLFKFSSKRKIASYLRENAGFARVNIGSGSNLLIGWLNGEIRPIKGTVYIDASKRLPFEDESVQFINCEHLIEHLSHETCLYFLKECFRVLKESGVLRISTPSLERLIHVYLGNSDLQAEELLEHHRKHYNPSVGNLCGWLNDHMRLWGHKFIFDEPTLINALGRSGFLNIVRCEYGKSEYLELQGIERHNEGQKWLNYCVMIFEACKNTCNVKAVTT